MPFSTFWLDPKNKVLVQNYNVLWPKRYYDPVSLNILSKVYRYSLNYFYASLISVSDVDFFANVGKVILPKISSSVKNTKDVQTFIDEFIEGTGSIPNLNNESIGADDGIEAPKKNVSITKFKEYLENNKDWLEWKFSVKVKVSEEIEEQSKIKTTLPNLDDSVSPRNQRNQKLLRSQELLMPRSI